VKSIVKQSLTPVGFEIHVIIIFTDFNNYSFFVVTCVICCKREAHAGRAVQLSDLAVVVDWYL